MLLESKTYIDLAIAKPTGLNDLGVPILETTVVKKGKLHEFSQPMADGKVGRMFQNLRITGIKTIEGGTEAAKIFISFEVFGDSNIPKAANSGIKLRYTPALKVCWSYRLTACSCLMRTSGMTTALPSTFLAKYLTGLTGSNSSQNRIRFARSSFAAPVAAAPVAMFAMAAS